MSKFQARRPIKGRRPDREKQPATVGVMEQSLDEFYEAVSEQVKRCLYVYHIESVHPRLQRLEMIFFRRWWHDLKPLRDWVKSKFQKKIEEPATTTPICTCGVEPEHTMAGFPGCKYLMKELPDAGHS